jgi:perosamine synthetase
MKRVKPYYKKEWIEKLDEFLKNWDYWKEGALIELENKVADHVGRKYAIATNSTTNSIFMCLYIWSKKHPDRNEVIMPNWGYPAAYKACHVLGLEPILVDINKWTLGMTDQNVFDSLNYNTLAVVHIENNGVFGNPEDIKNILTDEELFIEDAAPSLLQEKAGTIGDVAMFSFSPTKPFTAGEGSVIVTSNKEIYESLKSFRYIGEYTDLTTSLNFAMSCLLATYILPQFDIIDEIIQMREWVHNEYKEYIPIVEEHYISTNRHGAIMHLSHKAEQVSKKLSLFGIEHRHRYYPVFEEDYINYPISCTVRDQIIDLPMHQDLTSKEIKSICDIILREYI